MLTNKDIKEKIIEKVKKRFDNAGYGIFNHSAMEVCHWTKSSIRGDASCYKQKFYGIEAHRCIEMSPAFNVCTERCTFCWRPNEFYNEIDWDWDEPKEIINNLVELRRKKLSGFLGNDKVIEGKLRDAYYKFPNHWAISLSGEPTLYPKINELLKILRKDERVRSVYLVSNGTEYEVIKKLSKKVEEQPIQMYISVNSWDYNSFKEINKPTGEESDKKEKWENYLKSLELLKKFERSVLRFTIIRGVNDNIKNFEDIFSLANPNFIELKSYMHIGLSRNRLKRENMLNFQEILKISKNLEDLNDNFKMIDSYERSLISLIQNQERALEPIITHNDFGENIEIKDDIKVWEILKFKRAIIEMKKLGINYWDKDHMRLKEYGEEKYKKIINFIKENYNFN